jgi:hypothetical protein
MTVKAESSEKKETIVGTFATPQRKKVHTPPPPTKKTKNGGGSYIVFNLCTFLLQSQANQGISLLKEPPCTKHPAKRIM